MLSFMSSFLFSTIFAFAASAPSAARQQRLPRSADPPPSAPSEDVPSAPSSPRFCVSPCSSPSGLIDRGFDPLGPDGSSRSPSSTASSARSFCSIRTTCWSPPMERPATRQAPLRPRRGTSSQSNIKKSYDLPSCFAQRPLTVGKLYDPSSSKFAPSSRYHPAIGSRIHLPLTTQSLPGSATSRSARHPLRRPVRGRPTSSRTWCAAGPVPAQCRLFGRGNL